MPEKRESLGVGTGLSVSYEDDSVLITAERMFSESESIYIDADALWSLLRYIKTLEGTDLAEVLKSFNQD